MTNLVFPPREVLNSVIDILEDSEIYLDQKTVELSIAAMCQWLETENRGHEFMSHILKLQHVTGTHDKRYLIRDQNTALTRELKPENIIFLQGCVHKGEVLPAGQIEVFERDSNRCESCGASTICGQEVSNQNLCSHCLSCSDEQSTRDLVELNCTNCTFQKCSWNSAYRRTACRF